eukprot:scaffold50233_cov87-Phaeocystis_antarctica.AAC.1
MRASARPPTWRAPRRLTTWRLFWTGPCRRPLLLTTHYSALTTHHSPLTTHHSLLTTHYSPLTTHYSALSTHCSPLTNCRRRGSARRAHPPRRHVRYARRCALPASMSGAAQVAMRPPPAEVAVEVEVEAAVE